MRSTRSLPAFLLTPAWIWRFSPGACHNLAHFFEASDLPHQKHISIHRFTLRPSTSHLQYQHRHILPP